MTVQFDTASGRLRLDPASFRSLVAWADGCAGPPDDLAALREAGVLRPSGPHPMVAAGLDAVVESSCRVRLTATDHRGREWANEGWIGADGLAALLIDAASVSEFVTMPAERLPAALARWIGLGPRPRVGTEPWRLPHDLAERLLGSDPTDRRRVADRLEAVSLPASALRVVDAMVSGPWLSWRAAIAGTDSEQSGGRELWLVDTAAGVVAIESARTETIWWPTTPTEVWRLLIRLLPTDDELG